SASDYAVAAAAALPFSDAQFDLIIAYNVLMDIDNVPAALKEIRRVMQPAARLIVSIVHPFTDRGHFIGPNVNSPFVVEGSYFDRQHFEGVEERGGLRMHFAGWSQPLEFYAASLGCAGLAITSLREPRPVPSGPSHLARWA